MKKIYDLFRKMPLLTGIVGVALLTVATRGIDTGRTIGFAGMMLRIILAFAAMAFVALISGNKVFKRTGNKTGYGILRGLPVLIFPFFPMISNFVKHFSAHDSLVDKWPLTLLIMLVELIFVGIFEEMCFRALVHDAILYTFRDKKGVFVAIALISSFVFGVVHILGTEIGSPLDFAQAALKTITTAMGGFIFLIIYWKTGNIWACAIIHALMDIISTLSDTIFSAGGAEVNYVMNKEMEFNGISINMGWAAVVFYIFQLIFNAIIILTMIKTLKSVDFEKIRREW